MRSLSLLAEAVRQQPPQCAFVGLKPHSHATSDDPTSSVHRLCCDGQGSC